MAAPALPRAFVPVANVRAPTAAPARLPQAAPPKEPARNTAPVLKQQRIATQSSLPAQLTGEQQRLLTVLGQGMNVFMTGRAGTGKTYTLKMVMQEFASDTTFVVASTNIAAQNLGSKAMTFAKFMGIGIGDRPLADILDNMSRSTRANIEQCDMLIVDECSMLSAATMELADDVCRNVRGNPRPFGGIQLVLTGDMAQLQPVNSEWRKRIEHEAAGTEVVTHQLLAFRSERWRDWVHEEVVLTKIFRQTYESFTKVLENVRTGQVTPADVVFLKALDRPTRGTGSLVCLTANNDTADAYNNRCLDTLEGQERTFDTRDYVSKYGNQTLNQQIFEKFKTKTLARKFVSKIGARVVCIANVNGLVNGMRGIVIGYHPTQEGVRVKFDALPEPAYVFPFKWTELDWNTLDKNGRPYTICSRQAIPLRLAYAMTIHKSQGQGFDEMVIDAHNIFEHAQFYVALSRYQTRAPDASGTDPMRGLRVINLDVRSISQHPLVQQFYAELERRDYRASLKRKAAEEEGTAEKRPRVRENLGDFAVAETPEDSGEESDLDMFPGAANV